MLTLDLKKEPFWLELPAGVRVQVRPLTSALMHMAQAGAIRSMLTLQFERKALLDAGSDASRLFDLTDDKTRASVSHITLITELAKVAVIGWEGVYIPGSDEVAAVSQEHIGELMDIWFIHDAFNSAYMKQLDLLESEGNGLRPAQNGTSAAGRPTAAHAKQKTPPARAAKQAR